VVRVSPLLQFVNTSCNVQIKVIKVFMVFYLLVALLPQSLQSCAFSAWRRDISHFFSRVQQTAVTGMAYAPPECAGMIHVVNQLNEN
jgi:hypothetical protein